MFFPKELIFARSSGTLPIVSILSKPPINANTESNSVRVSKLIKISGGKSISGKKFTLPKKQKKGPLNSIKETLNKVKPATRVYLLLSLFCTLVHLSGLPAPEYFALDKFKLWQIWRFFTSVAYLGAPSMSMANSLYFLVNFGQSLETQNGTGAHAWFLLVQVAILNLLGLLLGFPLLAQSMIAATVYVSSHVNPMERIPFQFGFIITSWQLPFCMMLIDILSQQNISAAWPHILGILSGHFFHFFTKVWPELGGREMLKTPEFIFKMLGGRPTSNVEGLGRSAASKGRGAKINKHIGKKPRKLGSV